MVNNDVGLFEPNLQRIIHKIIFCRRSYDDSFGMLKESLEHDSRNLEISSEFFMSDFEMNIRNSWMDKFPSTIPEDCHFHFVKAIWLIVKKQGMKAEYSSSKKNPRFGTLVRAVIGLPFVSINRINEAFENLKKMLKRLKGKRSKHLPRKCFVM